MATSVSSVLVDSLPVQVSGASRSPFDLAATTAEVSGSGDSNFRVGGGRIGAFGVTLDGTLTSPMFELQVYRLVEASLPQLEYKGPSVL